MGRVFAPARAAERQTVARVLVSDSLATQGLEILQRARGIEVDYRPDLPPGDLLAAIADAEGLVIRSGTKVTADVIAAGTRLRVIGRAGIGVDNVDVPAATARGIVVMNTPGGNNITTAEHAIALLISLARHIPQATASMKAGQWEKTRFMGMELYNRTLGVLGLGNIGRIVADRARGLGMKVIAHDPYLSEKQIPNLDVELVSFDALLERERIGTIVLQHPAPESLAFLPRLAHDPGWVLAWRDANTTIHVRAGATAAPRATPIPLAPAVEPAARRLDAWLARFKGPVLPAAELTDAFVSGILGDAGREREAYRRALARAPDNPTALGYFARSPSGS